MTQSDPTLFVNLLITLIQYFVFFYAFLVTVFFSPFIARIKLRYTILSKVRLVHNILKPKKTIRSI
jgi:hypothetical protein